MAPEYPGAHDWDSDSSEDNGTMLTSEEVAEYGDDIDQEDFY